MTHTEIVAWMAVGLYATLLLVIFFVWWRIDAEARHLASTIEARMERIEAHLSRQDVRLERAPMQLDQLAARLEARGFMAGRGSPKATS